MRLPIANGDPFALPTDRAPAADGRIDCVVIGFHDIDFHERAMRARESDKASAYYSDVKLNSVLLDGKRHQYIDLWNRALEEVRGTPQALSPFRQPNLAVVYLTSFLRKRGLEAEYVNLVGFERDRFIDLLQQKPRMVALTTTFYVENEPIIEMVKLIREHAPDTKIVVGGPFVFKMCSFYDEITQDYLLSLLGADIYITDSQGEASLARLGWALRRGDELSTVPNLVWTDDGQTFQRSPRIQEKNDIDQNPIDWDLFETSYLTPTVYMRTARSCAFTCSFCSYPAVGGEHVANDLDVVMAQLRRVRERGVRNVVFIDDTFNVPLPRFKKLLRRMIEEKLDLEWISFFRCSNADDEAFALMRASGCRGAFLGIESGDQTVLGNMDKHARIERYRYGLQRLHEEGIPTYASLIIGFPGETARTVENTIEFINSTRPTFYFPNVYYHDVRAPIHGRAAEFGIQGSGYSWSHATMDWRECVGLVKNMYEQIDGSALCGGYSLSFWGVHYLWTQGFSQQQTVDFMNAARPMVLQSYDEQNATGFDRLVSILRG